MLISSVTRESKEENIFVNINIVNPSTNTFSQNASVSKTLNTPLVDNPSEYNLIISRFSIPGTAIPLFHFFAQPFPNTDVNVGVYTITIGYNGNFTAPINLRWLPQTFTQPIIPAFSLMNISQIETDPYYFDYSYVNIATMVTSALRTAILAGIGFLPAGVDAYMIYNNQSGFYSLLGTQNMYHSSNPFDPLNVQIWFNTPLYQLFTGFKSIHNSFNSGNGRDELILIENNLNNAPNTQDGFNPNIPAGYYQIQTEYNSDSTLVALRRILMVSNSFGGVVPQSEVNTSANNSYLNVITDFVPVSSVQTGSYRSAFQYYVQSEFYRRMLTNTNSLSNLSIDFYWYGRTGTVLQPLILNPGDALSIQFIFERKKTQSIDFYQ